MTEETVNLQLPYILSAQAQKHVTHNEALRRLDGAIQLVLISVESAPPEAPDEGACYGIGIDASGAWTGKEGRIALFEDGAWIFIMPRRGWLAWREDLDRQQVFDGSGWSDLPLDGSAHFARLGVNASADPTNRLSLSAPASLFNHEGAGHQIKINKAGPTETASLLYQSNWSGRAEMGLAGSDTFEIKVSADGASWNTAIRALPGGAVECPGRPLVRASYGDTTMTPANGALSGFNTLYSSQGGFSLGAAVPVGSGDRLVVPVSGYYLVALNVSSLATATYSVAVRQNDTTDLLTVRDSDSGARSYSQSATVLAYLAAGDWIALKHYGAVEFQFGWGKTELTLIHL